MRGWRREHRGEDQQGHHSDPITETQRGAKLMGARAFLIILLDIYSILIGSGKDILPEILSMDEEKQARKQL